MKKCWKAEKYLFLPAILAVVILKSSCVFSPSKLCRHTLTFLSGSTHSFGMTCMLPLSVYRRTPVWLQYCHALQFHFSELWQTNHKKKKKKKTLTYLHLSMFFPQRVGDTLRIILSKQSLFSGIWQTTLAQGRNLRCFSEKISKKLCLNLKARPGHKIVSHDFVSHG